MSRRPSNSKGGLDRLAVLNGDSAGQYVRVCEDAVSTVEFKPGVYSRSVNDNGWACPRGLEEVKTQGLIKSAAWAIRAIKKRAESGDAEAQIIIQNLNEIIGQASV
jgi:hypothetical protein